MLDITMISRQNGIQCLRRYSC